MKATGRDEIMHRQLSIWDYLQRDTAEREEYAGVCTSPGMVETETTNEQKRKRGLLEQIISSENLLRAAKRVKANRGSGGTDGMTVYELDQWLDENLESLQQQLRDGKYRPQPVRRVEIPKDKGKTRKLGIPTVIDRTVQEAICQVLSPIYEEQFSDYSYGFRPERSTHDALRQCQVYITEGYRWVVDMDLEKFFDTVNQSKLIQVLSKTIKDGRVVSLIHKYLRAGIMVDGMFEDSYEGVPQGGPLSPLLGNVILNECDKELASRGHRFVRYADDMLIFCRSRKAAERTLANITKYLEGKLFLKVNREKTSVKYVKGVKFLGYGFYIDKDGGQFRVHSDSIKKLKDKLRKLTGRSNGMSVEQRRTKLNQLIRGWVNYFKLAKMRAILEKLDGWLRRRLRMVTWKRWKKVKTKFENLKKTKLDEKTAWYLANTRNKYWYVAGSPWMKIALPNWMFEKAGYLTLSGCYANVK
jgi:group II intron reverse transcriptase/maturase